jgi:hypothetical protein
MSNFLAVAAVTATLKQTLQAAVAADVSGANVATERPGGPGGAGSGPTVNVYLYQVAPNAAWRNTDLPSRGAAGDLHRRPRVALDLHYLLTFAGDERRLEPQRLLGSVVRTLHTRPVLTRAMILEALRAAPNTLDFLAQTDLAEAPELVRFTPLGLSLEDLSKLWSVFFQNPYQLSVAYQGGVVLIETDAAVPAPALPVRQARVHVDPFGAPLIHEIANGDGPGQPIRARGRLRVQGRRFLARPGVTQVHVGDAVATMVDLNETEILATLPDGLRAGVHGLRVVTRGKAGGAVVAESNVAAFVLCPTVTQLAASVTRPGAPHAAGRVTVALSVRVEPPLAPGQRALIRLSALPDGATSHSVPAPAIEAETDTLKVDVQDVEPGTYLVRVSVDGAESALVVDTDPASATFDRYVGPAVVIPTAGGATIDASTPAGAPPAESRS